MKTEQKVAVRRVQTVYDRMNEARARRAEALALKEPANDARPIVKTSVTRAQKNQFPPISSSEQVATAPEPARKRPLWVWAIIVTSLGMLLLYLAVPQSKTPPAVAATPSAPDQPTQVANAPTQNLLDDAHAGQQSPLLAIPSANPVPPNVQDATAPKPRVTLVRAAPLFQTVQRMNISFDLVTARTVTRAKPAPLFEPLVASSFISKSAARDLAISFNIPRNASQDTINALVSAAGAVDASLGDPNIVNFTIKTTQVRFFHPADEPAATELANAIDANLRDFTSFEPSPATGFVEIWVKSQPAAPARESEPQRQNGLIRDIRQIGANLGNAIRSLSR